MSKSTKLLEIDAKISSLLLVSMFYKTIGSMIASLGGIPLPVGYRHPIVFVIHQGDNNHTIKNGSNKALVARIVKFIAGGAQKATEVPIILAGLDKQMEKLGAKSMALVAKRVKVASKI